MESKAEKSGGLTIDPTRDPDTIPEDESIPEEVRSPDPQLLEYQQKKKQPKISLTNITEIAEDLVLEIDKMDDLENTDQLVYGMLPAGQEECIVAKLKRQGSLTIEKEQPADIE